MTVEHYNNDSEGHFRAVKDGERIGTMTYFWSGENKIIINHTEVDPAFESKGVGQALVEAGVAFARERGIKIDPWCAFVKTLMGRKKEWKDVL